MKIQDFFNLHKSVAVAVSGGVDSAVLLRLALEHAERVKAYYVRTPFQPQFEYEDAAKIAEQLGAELEVLELDVLAFPEITANSRERCYFCKKQIFSAICAAAERDGLDTVCDGTNATDDVADRAGFRALSELGVKSPLRDCGITKADIRALAREYKLPVADKPSYACLATRIPAGTAITKALLEKTEAAENELFGLGFSDFRVRYLDGAAKLELSRRDFELLCEKKDSVAEALLKYYENVYLDLKERSDE